MTWSTPKTWASADVLTAADMNAYVRDNERWLAYAPTGGAALGELWRSTNQTAIASDDAIVFDTPYRNLISTTARGGILNGSGPYTLRVPSGGEGVYAVGGCARLAATYDGSGAGEVGISLVYDTGTEYTVDASTVIHEGGAARTFRFSVSAQFEASAANAIFELHVIYQNMSNVDVVSADIYSPVLWARRIGDVS